MPKDKDKRAARDLAERIERDRKMSIERDRKMILHPDDWPRWPTLPLTRRNGDLYHPNGFAAFLMSGDTKTLINGGGVVVYIDNMWRVPEIAADLKKANPERSVMWTEICERLKSKTFDNLDALLAEYTVD